MKIRLLQDIANRFNDVTMKNDQAKYDFEFIIV